MSQGYCELNGPVLLPRWLGTPASVRWASRLGRTRCQTGL